MADHSRAVPSGPGGDELDSVLDGALGGVALDAYVAGLGHQAGQPPRRMRLGPPVAPGRVAFGSAPRTVV